MNTQIPIKWCEKFFYGVFGKSLLKNRIFFVIGFHLFSIVFAYAGSFYIRFDFKVPPEYLQIFYNTLPLLLLCRLATYYFYKTYSASWRYAYLRDLMDVVKAVLLGSALFLALLVFFDKLQDFPRSVIFLELLLSLSIMSGTKLMFRYYHEHRGEGVHKVVKNVLIVGAGRTGVLMLNEIRNNKKLGINAAGFVDDNLYKKGTKIQGVPVLGSTDDIPKFVKKYAIDEILIAIPTYSYKNIVRITNIARNLHIKINVLPGLEKFINGSTSLGLIKDVQGNELLGRKELKFCRESDKILLEKEITGKVVLITGAGGSIGSELCRQVLKFNPRILIMYERYENSLYELELELKKGFPNQTLLTAIGDILNAKKFRNILQANRVNIIYHAAAYKHVPMMEREPVEAVHNNIIGTMNVAKLAMENNVDKFVLISTDKAVNSASVMGHTKRFAELIILGLNNNNNGTKFVSVRFGNVIGSNGSVIPLFKRQIAEGGPITVTSPEVTRYFMAIPEAVQLVMTASAMGNGGEIFLLDMGKPIKIVDIATDLIKSSGLGLGRDIDIVFTGLRPGEKLHEELYWQGEGIIPTENKKITMLKPNGVDCKDIFHKIGTLEEFVLKGDKKGTLNLLKEILLKSKQCESKILQLDIDLISSQKTINI